MGVIKFRPLTTSIDERVVVARLRRSAMYYNTFEIVQCGFSFIAHERTQIQSVGELQPTIILPRTQSLQIKLKALQVQQQVKGSFFDPDSFN